jgi:hypothetical protein
MLLLGCRSRELVYTGHIAKGTKPSETALLHVEPVEQESNHDEMLFNIVVEIDGTPSPLTGLTRAIALHPGNHDLVIAIMSQLTYSGKQAVVKYYRVNCQVGAGQPLQLRSRITDDAAECWVDDSQGSRTFGRELTPHEADLLEQRHVSHYQELEASGALRIQ